MYICIRPIGVGVTYFPHICLSISLNFAIEVMVDREGGLARKGRKVRHVSVLAENDISGLLLVFLGTRHCFVAYVLRQVSCVQIMIRLFRLGTNFPMGLKAFFTKCMSTS